MALGFLIGILVASIEITSPRPGALVPADTLEVWVRVDSSQTLRSLRLDTALLVPDESGVANCSVTARPPLLRLTATAARKGSEEERAYSAHWIGRPAGAVIPAGVRTALGPNIRFLSELVTQSVAEARLAETLAGRNLTEMDLGLLGTYLVLLRSVSFESPQVHVRIDTDLVKLFLRLRWPRVELSLERQSPGLFGARGPRGSAYARELFVEMHLAPALRNDRWRFEIIMARPQLVDFRTDVPAFPEGLIAPFYPKLQERIERSLADALDTPVETAIDEKIAAVTLPLGASALELKIASLRALENQLVITWSVARGRNRAYELPVSETLPRLPPPEPSAALRILLGQGLLDEVLAHSAAEYRGGWSRTLVELDSAAPIRIFQDVAFLFPRISAPADSPLRFSLTAFAAPRLVAEESRPVFLWPGIRLALEATGAAGESIPLLSMGGDIRFGLSVTTEGDSLIIAADTPDVRLEFLSAPTSAFGQLLLRAALDKIASAVGTGVAQSIRKTVTLPRRMKVRARMVESALLIEAGR